MIYIVMAPCQPDGRPPETATGVYNTLDECKKAIDEAPFERRFTTRMRCVPSYIVDCTNGCRDHD